jgi:hypothetical protein
MIDLHEHIVGTTLRTRGDRQRRDGDGHVNDCSSYVQLLTSETKRVWRLHCK